MSAATLPTDGLVRARPGLGFRAAGEESTMPTLFGHFLRFNEWTEIDSLYEGRFMERIAPGAAKRTLEQRGDDIKILFNHGHDPHIGEKPLTAPGLREDDEGVSYEGELFDTAYNRELIPGLEAGQYGASFKFRVIAEEINEEPDPSDHNPGGLPERTISEIKIYEGGPVTFPAYDGATAGVRTRSLTDEFIGDGLENVIERWAEKNPKRATVLLERISAEDEDEETDTTASGDSERAVEENPPAPSGDSAEDHPHPAAGRRGSDVPLYGTKSHAGREPWRLEKKETS